MAASTEPPITASNKLLVFLLGILGHFFAGKTTLATYSPSSFLLTSSFSSTARISVRTSASSLHPTAISMPMDRRRYILRTWSRHWTTWGRVGPSRQIHLRAGNMTSTRIRKRGRCGWFRRILGSRCVKRGAKYSIVILEGVPVVPHL